MSAIAVFTLLDLLKPAYFRTELRVPGGTSTPGFPGYCNGSGFRGMTKLTVTASYANLLPAIVFQPFNQFFDFHP